MRHAALTVRTLVALALALPAGGCYLFSTGGDGGPDAAAGLDASADGARDASLPLDAECLSFGANRLCGELCPLPCPEGFSCWDPEVRQICTDQGLHDPRGREDCSVDVRAGGDFCYSGRYCPAYEAGFDPAGGSGGTCVDEGYCAWARERGLGVQCRYSEGQPYVNGPPDVPCGAGAVPGAGFCGGACGDTCAVTAVFTMDPAACVGLSEERGFGVCAPFSFRCAPDLVPEDTLMECERRILSPGATCACMLLPGPLPEYADHGLAVARQTCLAYQRYFPDQVRCVDETWTDL